MEPQQSDGPVPTIDDFAGRPALESVLDDRRRRYLLYCLYLHRSPLSLPDIAHQVTVWEQADGSDVCHDRRLRTYMSLYHDHLPTLIGADLVCYEQGEDTVAFGPAADRLSPALESRLRTDIDDLLRAE